VNLDRLGLLDTEVLFREVERAERSKLRDRKLGRGGSRRDLERFLGQVSADFAQIRKAASEIRRGEASGGKASKGAVGAEDGGEGA
jgi:hypothetical protein